ncbi:MAG: TAT-variant-translocated molybdopterin oxidoreductase, partial [Verrucomicrobiaceae bacterium]|nr:TAT-variant-translocated molybdopterin oxidoreductase [Verrucomicrobiaceae bacterium]
KRMFRSLAELHDTAGFKERLEREFPQGAAELERCGEEDPVSRRRFMRLMGASTALAGLGMAACRRPVGKILPYARGVEWMIPGKAVYYATAMPRAAGATSIVAKVHEGRPTHLQGNPLHPSTNGGTDHFAVASILDLYDPERSRSYKKANNPITDSEFRSFFSEKKKKLADSGGEGLAFLHGAGTSPTRQRLALKVLEQFPKAKFYQFEAVDRDGVETATADLYGSRKQLLHRVEGADRILSIGCDFLGIDHIADDSTCGFSARRNVEDGANAESMNRLYVLEHQYTLTGGMADHRHPVKVGDMPLVTAHIAAKVGELTG